MKELKCYKEYEINLNIEEVIQKEDYVIIKSKNNKYLYLNKELKKKEITFKGVLNIQSIEIKDIYKNYFLLINKEQSKVLIYDFIKEQIIVEEINNKIEKENNIYRMINENKIIIGTETGSLFVYDLKQKNNNKVLTTVNDEIIEIKISKDYIFVSSYNNKITVYSKLDYSIQKKLYHKKDIAIKLFTDIKTNELYYYLRSERIKYFDFKNNFIFNDIFSSKVELYKLNQNMMVIEKNKKKLLNKKNEILILDNFIEEEYNFIGNIGEYILFLNKKIIKVYKKENIKEQIIEILKSVKTKEEMKIFLNKYSINPFLTEKEIKRIILNDFKKTKEKYSDLIEEGRNSELYEVLEKYSNISYLKEYITTLKVSPEVYKSFQKYFNLKEYHKCYTIVNNNPFLKETRNYKKMEQIFVSKIINIQKRNLSQEEIKRYLGNFILVSQKNEIIRKMLNYSSKNDTLKKLYEEKEYKKILLHTKEDKRFSNEEWYRKMIEELENKYQKIYNLKEVNKIEDYIDFFNKIGYKKIEIKEIEKELIEYKVFIKSTNLIKFLDTKNKFIKSSIKYRKYIKEVKEEFKEIEKFYKNKEISKIIIKYKKYEGSSKEEELSNKIKDLIFEIIISINSEEEKSELLSAYIRIYGEDENTFLLKKTIKTKESKIIELKELIKYIKEKNVVQN